MTSRASWSNWAGNQRCAPQRIERPRRETDLQRVVREAAEAGERVKAVGSGHSFTGIALTDGLLVTLDDYSAVLAADREQRTVTVQAGIRLSKLNAELDARGLALPNLGDVTYQSIAGAIATATHGTGAKLGGIATQVVGLRLISGDGSIIECSPSREPEVFHAARVGLGALGIVSTVTLQCVPAFSLRAVEQPMPVDELLDALDEHVEGNDHFEFFWVPHTRWALTKRNNRTDDPPAPRTRWQEFRDEILLSNVAFGLMCRVGRLQPSLIPRLATAVPSARRVEYTDKSYRVFASPRGPHSWPIQSRTRSESPQTGRMPPVSRAAARPMNGTCCTDGQRSKCRRRRASRRSGTSTARNCRLRNTAARARQRCLPRSCR
ncbi:MAG: FAD-binding protein [Dehalococcoidia bacterium]|nr:FAD-binding protein [Dehalococcoidia bacterium]